jgi:hypothetical protein
MTSNKKQNSVIVSVSSKDVVYCLSVYEPGDVILTPYKSIQRVYNKLGIKAIQTRYLFLWVLLSRWKMIYIFGQGPTFFLLYFRKVLYIFKKRMYYSDAYLKMQTRMMEPSPVLYNDIIYSYFPDWLIRFLKFGLYSANGYYWLHSCFIIADPIVEINSKITLNCKNKVIILDEILILFPSLLDFKRIASKYPLYLKRKSRGGGMVKVDPEVLKLFLEHTDTIVPMELYSDYHAIIGNYSTALSMPNSISVCRIVGESSYYDQIENAASYMPETLEELYTHLGC